MKSNKRSRIAHICTSDLSVRYLLRNQLKQLNELGYDVHALSHRGTFRGQLSKEPFKYHSILIYRRINPLFDVFSMARLVLFLRSLRPDLVHTHTNKAGILGCWAAAASGINKIVSTVHGFYFHEMMRPSLKAFFIKLYRMTFRLVDKVFMQSAEDVETAIRLNIVPREKLVHIGNGIDLSRFNPDYETYKRDAHQLRLIHNIPLDVILIGTISRLNKEKGIKELIMAFYKLKKEQNLPIHIVIIGGGPAKDEFKELANTLGIASEVHFTGFQNNIPGWLMSMDIFALPSYREGLPRSICEAFAMGTPAIASNIRGCRELIRDKETGILVPPKDSEALAEAILKLVKDERLRKRIARNARAYAKKFLNEDRVVNIIDSVYRELGLERPDLENSSLETQANSLEESKKPGLVTPKKDPVPSLSSENE